MLEKVKFAMLCMARQCWEQGVAAQALLECGDLEAMRLLARDCVVRQNPDGRLCDVEGTPALVDPAVCVEPVLAAERLRPGEGFAEAAARNVEYLLHDAPATTDGARYQLTGGEQVWADSMAMGPHVLMQCGHIDEGWRFYRAIRKRLLDERSGLYRHMWDEGAQRFARDSYWGVGIGWALIGLMRMTRALTDAGDPRATEASSDFRALVDAMLPWQGANGLFHDVLDHPETFEESESTEMFAYAIYKMVAWNLLDDTYLPHADLARQAVNARIDADGIVRGCAGSPTFDREGTSVEGQAHWIMMEVAAKALGR